MALLNALFETYESAEKQGLVDKQVPHNVESTILAPLYHKSKQVAEYEFINIKLNKNGELIDAEFLNENDTVIFPVTIDSISRSSNVSAHPLVDKISYVLNIDEKKHHDYLKTLLEWYNSESLTADSKEYLNIIIKFIGRPDNFKEIVEALFKGIEYSQEDTKIKFKNPSTGKDKTLDLSKVYLTYTIMDFKGMKDISVSNNKRLHQDYIKFINDKYQANGICMISGQAQHIISKHRSVIGRAKLISVSNNKETYYGRFKSGDDLLNIGYETSEKIHLMLDYLLQNENSSKYFGENQYLINWFTDDISNESKFDPTTVAPWELEIPPSEEYIPVSTANKMVGESFVRGVQKFDEDADYYIAILDKINDGRVAAKYFKKLSVSKLFDNLKKWQINNSWVKHIYKDNKKLVVTPTIRDFVNAAFGIESNNYLRVSNKSFEKSQLQNLVSCLIEGRDLPLIYYKNFDRNSRQRLRYKNTWNRVLTIFLAGLNNFKGKEFTYMLDASNTDRSYLFGRLLAIYERIEASALSSESLGTKRTTNAEKLWSAFTRNPATISKTLEDKTKVYEAKLQSSNYGLYIKIMKEKAEIISSLSQYLDSPEINKALSFEYLFGYYAELDYIFTKNADKTKESLDD